MIEAIGKITEVAAKTVEKLSEASSEIKAMVDSLDIPLNVEEFDELIEDEDIENSLEDLDKPLNDEVSEYNEDGFRPLTQEEMQDLRDNTDWPDKVEGIQGCKINDEGIIKYPCRNETLAGTANPLTGVEYEKRIVEINEYKVEVVMPKFDSAFEAQLPEDLLKAKDKAQFVECNKQLYEAIQKEPDLAKKFTSEQIEQIKDGMIQGGAPDGYTWHHDAETGKMQLVDSDMHGDSRHTGGKTLWGGGNDYR